MSSRLVGHLRRLTVLVFWIIVWALASTAVNQELLLPGPLQVARRLAALASTVDFWLTLGRSILRILTGIVSAVILGVWIGLFTHKSIFARELLSPVMTLLKSTPVASFIILALVWLGRSVVPIFIAGLMVLPVIWANTAAGLAGIDPQLLEMAKVYSLPRRRVLLRIVWPSLLPYLRSALRSALGLGWKAGIAAEVLTVPPRSIGKSIFEAKLYLETTELFAWTAAVIALSFLIERVLLRLVDGIGRKELKDAQAS
ncbi:MAG: ABC transporter permease subunit [Oscillospiraceae bacterium]|nr:ABC transporter permease subunit [Oscillospiraceae bacterium]